MIYVAADDGLHTFDRSGNAGATYHEGRPVTGLAPDRSELWAVIERSEIWHTTDLERWHHVGDLSDRRATCVAAVDWGVLLGSSEAHLYRVTDGQGPDLVASFDDAPGRPAWHTPWGGPPDTRSVSEWSDDVYVNIHVGGILRTDDSGKTWEPTIDIDADVHQVATANELVLAACAGGLASSTDRGRTWTFRTDGLDAPYARAVVVCGERVLVTASTGPRGGRAGIYRGDLRSGAFERCRSGLPEWFTDNIDTHRVDGPPDGSLAAFASAEGRLFVTEDAAATWSEIATGLAPVHRVVVVE